ncbi:poly-beta-hydroxybutyrate polymerase [Sphingobium indicum IP26]|uniref:Poly-beta-hydroxybutyrate polymerase n=1 Tax=Sphingobium indicum F2 TaxID=1450518 RepID=A0A8E0WVF0_9SPHN|nr:alpha/beta fold hydrolase [Sphingobium indicum]EPR10984.1 poly-beta-hydroxybutyrate polymerase [Sphingobium indicum IP26]EPR11354.1 poly-beta-hydroxybutyrate polymerase [Sphingobium indicum IP26]KER38127.1 poly-beta-hydroxybutyrate polymerase [Sphingobium indicum F2]
MSADNMSSPPDPLDGIAETLDRAAGAGLAQMTAGLSPATILQAFSDWGLHLAFSPGKQLQLAAKAARKRFRLLDYAVRSARDGDAALAIKPLPQDRRFSDPAWRQPPFNLFYQGFLLNQQWLHAATSGVSGVTRHHEDMVAFTARQMLDTLAPTNFLATNPVLQQRIVETGGKCLVDGFQHLLEDMQRLARGEPPVGAEDFRVGETVATARGKIVYRNRLVELIQYEPTTEKVRPEPILIVPAWIMKYYILDLSPENSLVRWLTDQGFTVFMISWHNPGPQDRDLDMEDYRKLGPMAALDAVTAITGGPAIHAVGYCLGGTLLSIAAAAMARDGDERLASVTLFAAQTEFSEPGELGLFIDEGQLNLLENMMWGRGYLDSSQMGGAFQILKSNDLVWSRVLGTYLMGEREPMSDLMAWNADGTRMPYAMHSQYLRRLFLDDDLAEGKYQVDGRTIALSAFRKPMFLVGTERDHVAPWRSVHKIHLLTGAEITFVLTSGGHNAGIVSEPGHKGRGYRVMTREADGLSYDADEWQLRAEQKQGSWWLEWGDWLARHSGEPKAPPPMGAPDKDYTPLAEAPGHYVLEH